MSDDTNHDSIMTNNVISSIIESYPDVMKSGKLVLRTDNCSTQYKSQFVFQNLINLSKKYGIEIAWFYGEPGHGRGLIDAMAWFGAKQPLLYSILADNKWFANASEITFFYKAILMIKMIAKKSFI